MFGAKHRASSAWEEWAGVPLTFRVWFRRALKRGATLLPLEKQASLVATLLPKRFWFRAALLAAKLQGRMVAQLGGTPALTEALMLDFWMRQLTFHGPFPIPYRVHGLNVLQSPGAKMYTWPHLPHVEIPLLPIMAELRGSYAVVADSGKIAEGERFVVFGTATWPEALRDDEHLLLRVRRKLSSGTSVTFLADPWMGAPLSRVPLRIAARLRVPLVWQWAELAPDRVFDVHFAFAPHPFSETEAEMEANLAFLQEARQRALDKLGWGTSAAVPQPGVASSVASMVGPGAPR